MKLISFIIIKDSDNAKSIKLGAYLNESEVIDLAVAASILQPHQQTHFQTMLSFLEGGNQAREVAENVLVQVESKGIDACLYQPNEIQLLSPLNPLSSLRDFMAFEDHIINCIRVTGLKKFAFFDEWLENTFGRRYSIAYALNKSFYKRPAYYKGNPRSLIGTNSEVNIPAYTKKMDYELEFGIFIGKKGKNIKAKDASNYIGGYSIFNDFSARDEQLKEQAGRLGPAKGKDFDTSNAIGPYLVTPDEVCNPYNLAMTARINGEEWSRGTTADMYWSFEELIEYVSRDETIYPGDFFGSGTCSGKLGKGCGLELGRFLQPGDVVELEVEKLGILRNQIAI